jgi:hypothetical protein
MDTMRQRLAAAFVSGDAGALAELLRDVHAISFQTPSNKAAELNVNSKLGHPANDKINMQ